MKRIHLVLAAGGAMLAMLLAGAPAAAAPAQPGSAGSAVQAEPSNRDGRAERIDLPKRTPLDGARSAAAGNGYFYAYEHAYWGGRWCAWAGNASNWVNPGGPATTGQWGCGGDYSFDNIATSVWNNGVMHTYDAVRMRTGAFLTGGSMCLSRGDYWADFTLGYQAFDDGTAADNQISSHYWGVSCS